MDELPQIIEICINELTPVVRQLGSVVTALGAEEMAQLLAVAAGALGISTATAAGLVIGTAVVACGGVVYSAYLSKKPLELVLRSPPTGPFCEKPNCKEKGCTPKQSERTGAMEDKLKSLGICKRNYHFAVAGLAGVGKSSFINRLRGIINDNDERAHTVSSFGEGTKRVGFAQHVHIPHLFLVDLPGSGGDSNPQHRYFFDKGCFAYDIIILVVSDRFGEIPGQIIAEAERWKVPWIVVRSKCDIIFRDMLDKEDLDPTSPEGQRRLDEEKVRLRREVQGVVADKLRNYPQAEEKVFLVNAFTLGSKKPEYAMDENKLLEWIATTASERRNAERAMVCEKNIDHDIAHNQLFIASPCSHKYCHECCEIARRTKICEITEDGTICGERVVQFVKVIRRRVD